VRIDQSTRDGCTILAPVGQLDLDAVSTLRRVLLKRLAERPVAVICDLSGLQEMDPSCADVFTSVANHPSSSWAATNVLVCCAPPAVSAMLERLGMTQSWRRIPPFRRPSPTPGLARRTCAPSCHSGHR
jgi:anti-anti-sigma regulatory factor